MLFAYYSWAQRIPADKTFPDQCLRRIFEELYTCPQSSYDYAPGQSPGSWGYWDWEPLCFVTDPQQEAASTFCLVSSASFNSDHGLSIVAKKETIVNLQKALINREAASRARPHLDRDHSDAYEKKDIPRKGVGTIARRKIQRGEVFITALPAIVFDNEFRTLLDTTPEGREVYQRAKDQLADRQRVMGLAKRMGGHELEDVLGVNSHTGNVFGRAMTLLYPEVARLNHACTSNALVRLAPSTMIMEVIAAEDIAAGEEITINYIEDGLVSSDRQTSLSSIFEFECRCALCAASEAFVDRSDRNRRRLKEIWTMFAQEREGSSAPSPKAILDLTSELLELAAEEKLGPSLMKRYYHDLMRVFFEHDDIPSAIAYAQKSLELATEFDGSEDPDGLQEALRRNLEVLRTYL